MPSRTESDRLERDMRYHRRTIFALLVIIAILAIGWMRSARHITVYTPPDVSKSFMQHVGEVPPPTLYGFARTLLESLYYCDTDCGNEYPARLNDYRAYITGRCLTALNSHFQGNRNLYNYRSRLMLPTQNAIYSDDKVQKLSNDSWVVNVEYELREVVGNTNIRSQIIRYPMQINRSQRPLTANPLGLEFDCFTEAGPIILEDKSQTAEKQEAL